MQHPIRRRRRADIEIFVAMQEVIELTEAMDLMEEEILMELISGMDRNRKNAEEVVLILKARNPRLENIAIMSEDGRMKVVLLFSDKTGVVVRRRRTVDAAIRNLLRTAI